MAAQASTQSTLSILDIKNNIVVLNGGHYRVVWFTGPGAGAANA